MKFRRQSRMMLRRELLRSSAESSFMKPHRESSRSFAESFMMKLRRFIAIFYALDGCGRCCALPSVGPLLSEVALFV